MRRSISLVFLLLVGCADSPAPPPEAPSASVGSASAAPSPSDAASSGSGAPTTTSAAPTTSAVASAPIPDVPAPPAPDPPITLASGGKRAVSSDRGLVVSVESNATRAGVEVLEAGGNAIDAAVAVGYALAVTHPSAGNLGGGGFMIVKLKSGESIAIDFREMAPKSSTTEKVVAEVAAGGGGYASMVVPGTVAGLNFARDKFGTKPLAELVAPAKKLAESGHKVSPRVAMSLKSNWGKLKSDPSAASVWGKGKEVKKAGDRVVQPDLAKTLDDIAKNGTKGFYTGRVADLIEAAMKKNKGDLTKEDLAAYEAKTRKPLTFSYRGFTIETMPPPSMGGIAVAETLLAFERAVPHDAKPPSADTLHLFIESAKWAYADRRSMGADPDFFPADAGVDRLIAKALSGHNLTTRTPAIDPKKANAASAFKGPEPSKESPETTHFSVIDAEGNAVSCTVTLSAAFGSKVMIPGTGVFFSNALGAFTASGANEVKPHKRMASSMSPTIASRGGKVEIVAGSPGGDTIPNTVSQTLINLIDFEMPVDEAVMRGRVHHQLLPDVLRTEKQRDLSAKDKAALKALGHTIEPHVFSQGDAKIIVRNPSTGMAWGFSDDREGGLAAGPKR